MDFSILWDKPFDYKSIYFPFSANSHFPPLKGFLNLSTPSMYRQHWSIRIRSIRMSAWISSISYKNGLRMPASDLVSQFNCTYTKKKAILQFPSIFLAVEHAAGAFSCGKRAIPENPSISLAVEHAAGVFFLEKVPFQECDKNVSLAKARICLRMSA